MSKRILCVDDEPNLLEGIQRNLRKRFDLTIALGGEAGLEAIKSQGPFAVVVADMQMPGMNGIEFLKAVENRSPETVRVMLTGNADQKTAMDAVNEGHIFRFLSKPCPLETLTQALDGSLEQYRLISAERKLLEGTLNGAVKVLTEILATIDPQSFTRAHKIRDYVECFTKSLKNGQAWELELASMLASIGRTTIPATVLLKERSGLALSVTEKQMLQRVPAVGADLLEKIPRLEKVARIVRYQAKDFDGGGFPDDSLFGEQIPVGARILKVIFDLVDLEGRGVTKAAALDQMDKNPGRYDPLVLAAACKDFDISLPEAVAAKLGPLSIRINELQEGHVLAQDLKMTEGMLIVASGTKLSAIMIERLNNFRALKSIGDTVFIQALPGVAETPVDKLS